MCLRRPVSALLCYTISFRHTVFPHFIPFSSLSSKKYRITKLDDHSTVLVISCCVLISQDGACADLSKLKKMRPTGFINHSSVFCCWSKRATCIIPWRNYITRLVVNSKVSDLPNYLVFTWTLQLMFLSVQHTCSLTKIVSTNFHQLKERDFHFLTPIS